jgi:hypothetical protein
MNGSNQLSTEQIDKLFNFVRSKYVRYEDLRYELVDHLASSIEDIQAAQPEASFEDALQETYSRFPITGFTNYIAQKQKALSRYWFKKFLRYYIEFFKLPKIIILIAMSLSIWSLYQEIRHDFLIIGTAIIIAIFMIIGLIQMGKNRLLNEKYMFIGVYNGQLLVSNMFFFYMVINIRYENLLGINYSSFPVIIFSLMTAFFLLVNYANFKVFPALLREEVQNKYAHLNIELA